MEKENESCYTPCNPGMDGHGIRLRTERFHGPDECPPKFKQQVHQNCPRQAQVYSHELESDFLEKNRLKPPYGALFSGPGRQLLYIAANHTTDPKSETVQLIDRAFCEYQPDCVIIEGIEGRESPITLMAYIRNLAPSACPENLYAAQLAVKNQVPFMGAEPKEHVLLNALLATKYTKKDLLFLFFIQQVGHYYRSSQQTGHPFKSLDDLPAVFALCVQDLKKPEYSLADFKQWYEQELSMTLSYHDLMDPNHCAPLHNGTPLQQLASAVSIIRDQHIVSVILKSMKKYKKVLIIYGHSHFVTQKEVLSAYFGKPRYINAKTDCITS